jgi:quercetin dioxygenase-like cupin family protein
MDTLEERLRQHPTDRFRAPSHHINLPEVASRLQAEVLSQEPDHRQETLYRYGAVTIALFLFQLGASMSPHAADGVVTVHVLEGRIRMTVESETHQLSAGQLMVMAPGVKHDVHAEEASRMLLTVCLDTRDTEP